MKTTHSDIELGRLLELEETADRQAHRLAVAAAYVDFLHRAYEALRDYGVDYLPIMNARDFPEEDLTGTASWQAKTQVLVDWLDDILTALTAACRRQSFVLIKGTD